MSTSSQTINFDAKRLVSVALLLAIIFSLMSVIMAGPLLAATQPLPEYTVPVGGTVLPAELAFTPAITTVILATMVAAAAVLTAVIFKGRK